jgi:allantoin racemase
VEEDGADTIILGCTSLIGFDEWLKEELKVPVIAPANLAIKILELLVDLNLTQSKKTYKTPEHKYNNILSKLS